MSDKPFFYSFAENFKFMAGIYLHVPFCKRRCIYCDFFSTTQSERKTAYIHAVCSELEMRKEYLGGETIETIYWGGGTPSQLDKEDFETIFYYLHKNYSISSHPEITLEANPDDLTPDYIAMLRTLPFNRGDPIGCCGQGKYPSQPAASPDESDCKSTYAGSYHTIS